MTATEVIKKINKSTGVVDVFEDLTSWKALYIKYSKLIHPDICREIGSTEAFQKLNEYKIQLEDGKRFTDDAGAVVYYPKSVDFTGNESLLKTSYDNYNKLMSFKDSPSVHFKKYIPETGKLVGTNESTYTFFRRAVPLSQLGTIDQKYVNFILSRMLEFIGWINMCGYSHAGINPDSVWVIPEDHGIQVVSFYHMKPLGVKLKTVSGKFSQLYPASIFTNKLADSYIDIELAKRTAIWLLGDKSGTGNTLRKTHNKDFINFVQRVHYDPIECFHEYRDMLRKNFDTKQFHILNI